MSEQPQHLIAPIAHQHETPISHPSACQMSPPPANSILNVSEFSESLQTGSNEPNFPHPYGALSPHQSSHQMSSFPPPPYLLHDGGEGDASSSAYNQLSTEADLAAAALNAEASSSMAHGDGLSSYVTFDLTSAEY